MSLPARQQRVIDETENALRASEPRLTSMYAIFLRLNQNEPVAAEPLTAARRRRRGPGDAMFAIVLVPVLFTMIIMGVLLGGARNTGGCDAGYAVGGAAAAGSQAACPATGRATGKATGSATSGASATCGAGTSATATGQAGSAAESADAARFVTRTGSEQALSPPSATSDTSGVC